MLAGMTRAPLPECWCPHNTRQSLAETNTAMPDRCEVEAQTGGMLWQAVERVHSSFEVATGNCTLVEGGAAVGLIEGH